MKTLFISTYTNKITIGILNNEIFKKEVISNMAHSRYLIPTLEEVLKEAKITLNEIEQIIVVNGPGSFTGVRLGVIVAKTIAYTLNKKIKTITSLDALAISNANLNYKTVIIKDNKGYFKGVYENNKLISDYSYNQSNKLPNEVNILESDNLDLTKIFKYMNDKKETNHHEVNPVYIKNIEALNDKKNK